MVVGSGLCMYDVVVKSLRSLSHLLMSCLYLQELSIGVAEMGDRGHNRHGPKRGGLLCPFRGGAGSPSNTMSPGPRSILPYKVASSSIQPFGYNRHEPKTGVGALPLLGGSCDHI